MVAHLHCIVERIGAGGTGVPAPVTSVFFTRAPTLMSLTRPDAFFWMTRSPI
ncbi:hypothetical protein GYMLUDRAFT_616257 [Collybiopsis luxurians FD-317 M1]|uniref:Uncharacterized protein n=1 Tax=Collybiopsis luxurians FD-317 M1 TaxID=944289 RepID=A0A0D0CBS7_9AGAR|nr:hypothetical protein GYMLUDRAFT_616257 [Collybiopsis luxurians FD-317 M1]